MATGPVRRRGLASRRTAGVMIVRPAGDDVDLPEGWTAKTVTVDGVDLQCYCGGEGPPLVAAHGFYGNGRCWLPLATDLTDEYEVVTYDARSHGRSDAPETGYHVRDRVADLAGVVDGLGLDDPVLLGHSMGAATAAWTAAERDFPRAAVLEDPVGVHTSDPDMGAERRATATRERLRAVEGRSVERLIETEYDDYDPAWARRLAVAATECRPRIAEYAREGYPEPLRAVFERIDCPTLVLRSDAGHDRRVRDLGAAESLADGRLVHVHDAGHYVFHDQPGAARAELRAFLARL